MNSLHPIPSTMKGPSDKRPTIWREGVIQVWVTRACDKSCFGCTQGSNLAGKPTMMSPDQYATALDSLKGYFGVIGMFGGNPPMHPEFAKLCEILRDKVSFEQRGIWSNNPLGQAHIMRQTFNPAISNLNVHMDEVAYRDFYDHWPECRRYLKGLDTDSRHAPPFVAMRDILKKDCGKCDGTGEIPLGNDGYGVISLTCGDCDGIGKVYDEENAWELIGDCDVNQYWSAMIGVFRGQLRAWFCELAGAQSMLHQNEPDYPDTGVKIESHADSVAFGYDYSIKRPDGLGWWAMPIDYFTKQIRKHCHDCGIPLRSYGELAIGGEVEKYSATHESISSSKRKGRRVELVTVSSQLNRHVPKSTDYLENGGLT